MSGVSNCGRSLATVDALRVVEEFAASAKPRILDGSIQELSKSVGELALASDLPDDERVALFYALHSVHDAILESTKAGYNIARLEAEALEEYCRLKDEAFWSFVGAASVSFVCLVVIAAALVLREPEAVAPALALLAGVLAPRVFAGVKKIRRKKR